MRTLMLMGLVLALFTFANQRQTRPNLPAFEGEVGQLTNCMEFMSFVLAHENQAVTLDITFKAFDGAIGEDTFFVLWTECANQLAPGEKPTADVCEGYSFNIHELKPSQRSRLFEDTDKSYHLSGNFHLGEFTGPYQGLMGCGLKPLD